MCQCTALHYTVTKAAGPNSPMAWDTEALPSVSLCVCVSAGIQDVEDVYAEEREDSDIHHNVNSHQNCCSKWHTH